MVLLILGDREAKMCIFRFDFIHIQQKMAEQSNGLLQKVDYLATGLCFNVSELYRNDIMKFLRCVETFGIHYSPFLK